jgi:Major tropism determinant N-terminal domain
VSDHPVNFPPTTPLTRPNLLQKNFFPFDAFAADDPNVTAVPSLTLASPWVRKGTFSGTGTALTNAIADTAANMASNNPTLLKGQIGYETDTKYFKIGDGSTAYNSLLYQFKQVLYSGDAAYTPSFQGFGTPTGVNFFWSRMGNRIKVMGKFTSGTTTAVEARIGLPIVNSVQLVSDAALIPSIMMAPGMWNNASASYGTVSQVPIVLIESGVGYVTFGSLGTGSGFAKTTGSAMCATGQTISLWFELPVSGWNV